MKKILSFFICFWMGGVWGQTIHIGSKNFTESYVLGELLAQVIETHTSLKVQRHFGLGGTGIVYEALKNGEIDLYVEYTGTLSEAILKNPQLKSFASLQAALNSLNLMMSHPLGFNNTYALAVPQSFAKKEGLTKISDLTKKEKYYRFAFSYEFVNRSDGLPALLTHYGLAPLKNLKRMDHALVYEAVRSQQVDVIEVYSTDAKLTKFDLYVLQDDLSFFPVYNAVILTTQSFVKRFPQAWQALRQLEGRINEELMRQLNAEVDIKKKSARQVVAKYLTQYLKKPVNQIKETWWSKIWQRTKEHLSLVGVSLFFSIILGLPLGIMAQRKKTLGQFILLFSGLLQTIPSLALLCFLIPLFGIGLLPALVALILYGLLPVVVGTYEGLKAIDPKLQESAQSLGLTERQKLRLIELPLASPHILAGIRTSTIIGIGTATLAALIGAGGYGAPIITGLTLNDLSTILMGAIPAALMAVVAHGLFEILRKLLVPKGLRL